MEENPLFCHFVELCGKDLQSSSMKKVEGGSGGRLQKRREKPLQQGMTRMVII